MREKRENPIEKAGNMWYNKEDEILNAIEDILRRGGDAEVRRKGRGYVVLEVKKTIKYSDAPPIVAE